MHRHTSIFFSHKIETWKRLLSINVKYIAKSVLPSIYFGMRSLSTGSVAGVVRLKKKKKKKESPKTAKPMSLLRRAILTLFYPIESEAIIRCPLAF